MSTQRRTHRSAVSYIDKSREYYAAQGYDQPYQWAAHSDAPFAQLPKPLAECRIGLVTTSYFLPDGFEFRVPSDLPRLPYASGHDGVTSLDNEHLSWAKDETHTEDIETFLPLKALEQYAQDGRIKAVSDRFYCLPTQYSHRQTQRRDVPKLIEWMAEDEVDAVILVPL